MRSGAAVRRSVQVLTLLLLGVVGVCAWGIWVRPLRYFGHPLLSDFALYYRDARVGVRYGWPHMYDAAPYWQVTHRIGIVNQDPLPSLSPPLLTWIAAPFQAFPLPAAFLAWTAMLGVLLLVTWRLTAPGGKMRAATALAALAAWPPVVFAIGLGQSMIIVAAAVAGACAFLRRGRDVEAGLILAVAVVKPQLIVLVPLALLAAGRWRAAGGLCAGVLAVVLAALVIAHPSAIAQYLRELGTVARDPAPWGVNAELTLASLPGGPLLRQAARVGVAALVALVGARQGRQRVEVAVAAGLTGSLLVTPYLHYEDLTLLLVAAWLWMRTDPPRWQRVCLPIGYALVAAGLTNTIPALKVLEVLWLVLMLLPWRAPAAGRIELAEMAGALAYPSVAEPSLSTVTPAS